MGLFYAYLKNEASGSDHHSYIIAFANREAADEWWRTISTPPSPYAATVDRLSPQFYIQSTTERNVINFASRKELPDAKQLHRKMHTMLLKNVDGKIPMIIPPTTVTDHISGKWYFVRSTADPWSHWYLRIKGECLECGGAACNSVHVSGEHRTKFCVRIRNSANDTEAPKDLVMIGRDEVSIAGPKGYMLHISDGEDLKATEGYQGETDLLFGDLKNRFITRGEKHANGEIWEYVESVEKGLGEAWELVD